MPKPLFSFYELVIIASEDHELEAINGEQGVIFAQSEDRNAPAEYGVYVFRDEEVWTVAESDLISTGILTKRENYYAHQLSVGVSVDQSALYVPGNLTD